MWILSRDRELAALAYFTKSVRPMSVVIYSYMDLIRVGRFVKMVLVFKILAQKAFKNSCCTCTRSTSPLG